MEIQKILTHSGVFHADEVLAIATIAFINNIILHRPCPDISRVKEVKLSDLEDPSILIVDIGGTFDPENLNFDHHQDASLDASCSLVLDAFMPNKGMKKYLKEQLFNSVSRIDKGEEKSTNGHFTRIISALNYSDPSYVAIQDESFSKAVNMTKEILIGYAGNYKSYLVNGSLWDRTAKIGYLKVFDKAFHLPGWRQRATSENVFAIVTPNHRSGYNLISSDTEVLKIPEHKTQSFRHNNGYIAVYRTKELAINHAKELGLL